MHVLKLAIFGCLALAAAVTPSYADITPVLEAVTSTPDGFLWTYRVEVSAVQRMVDDGTIPTAGVNPEDDTNTLRDYLTIYDFAGLQVANPAVVQFSETGFDYRVYAFGATPADTIPQEDADPNVTIFRAAGAGDLSAGTTFFIALLSSVGGTTIISYAGEGTSTALNSGESNVGETLGPGVGQSVPEPGTLLLLGAGISALAIRMTRPR